MRIYYPVIKRLIDFTLSLIGIIVASPFMLITAILVRIKLGSPITFTQPRPGKDGKTIRVYKFRSMTNEKGPDGELLPDSVRLTKFGKILRSTSLDELPQLFSILKGDMSIIGPRPQSFENVFFMTDEQRMRQIVTPSLTGLAQVKGRNSISWDKKLQYDLDYIKKITFIGDLKIFIETIAIVLFRKGISQEGQATTETVGQSLVSNGSISKSDYEVDMYIFHQWYNSLPFCNRDSIAVCIGGRLS